MGGLAELGPKGLERLEVIVCALDVSEPGEELRQDVLVQPAGRLEARPGPRPEGSEITRAGYPDDRQVEALLADQPGQGREDLLEGEVAGSGLPDGRLVASMILSPTG
jgi:hypothetical protein